MRLCLHLNSGNGGELLKRIEIIEEIVKSTLFQRRPSLLISNLGYCSRELYSLADRASNFYMLGSMGLASSIGLGLSLVRRRRQVIALDGDASVLMNLGTLSTIANFAPTNFHLIIVDNRVHGSTGGQESNTSLRTDLAGIAKEAGVRNVVRVKDRDGLRVILRKLPTVIIAESEPANEDVPIIPLSAREIKKRFTKFIGSS